MINQSFFTWHIWLASAFALAWPLVTGQVTYALGLEHLIVLVTGVSFEPIPVIVLAHCWEIGPVLLVPALDNPAANDDPLDLHWTILAWSHWFQAFLAPALVLAVKWSQRTHHCVHLEALARLITTVTVAELFWN